jgi:GDPmannose 4,6-dehydratase
VRTCVEAAFSHVGITLEWKGAGVDEKWYNTATGEVLVEIDPRYFRPAEVDVLLWDATKAKKELWRSPKYTFEELIAEMVAHDIDIFKKEVLLKDNWYTTLHQHE